MEFPFIPSTKIKAFPQLLRHEMPGDIDQQFHRDNSNTKPERGSCAIIQPTVGDQN